MFKALCRGLLHHLKGQGVEEKFVYCESEEEEVSFQVWLRVQLTRKVMRNDTVKKRVE